MQIDRSSGKKTNLRRPDSALLAQGGRLFKEVVKFVVNSKGLTAVTLESVEVPKDILMALGKSLIATSSGNCVRGADLSLWAPFSALSTCSLCCPSASSILRY